METGKGKMKSTVRLAGPAETSGSTGTLNFVSLAEVLAYIEVPSDSGTNDALIQTLIDSACVAAFGWMNGRFLKRPTTSFDYVFTPPTEDTIYLPQYPMGTVELIEIGELTSHLTWTSTYTLDANDWNADEASGRVFGSWPNFKHSVRIKWPGGYTTAPADAKEAIAKHVGIKLQRLRKPRWDITSQTSGGTESATYDREMPEDIRSVWSKYRTPTGSVR